MISLKSSCFSVYVCEQANTTTRHTHTWLWNVNNSRMMSSTRRGELKSERYRLVLCCACAGSERTHLCVSLFLLLHLKHVSGMTNIYNHIRWRFMCGLDERMQSFIFMWLVCVCVWGGTCILYCMSCFWVKYIRWSSSLRYTLCADKT